MPPLSIDIRSSYLHVHTYLFCSVFIIFDMFSFVFVSRIVPFCRSFVAFLLLFDFSLFCRFCRFSFFVFFIVFCRLFLSFFNRLYLVRVMGATLQIMRASEDARAEREGENDSRKTRSELFNLSDVQVNTVGAEHRHK